MTIATLAAGCPDASPDQVPDGRESSSDGAADPSSSGVDSGSSTGGGVEDDADDSGTSDTAGAGPVCGDGIVEGPELCDDAGESVACDADCTPAICGDGRRNAHAGEECDTGDLGGQTCEGLGFDVGVLACGGACRYDVSECYALPEAPVLELSFSQVKRFDFAWEAVAHADYYQLEQSLAPGEPFALLSGGIAAASISYEMPLLFRWQASYRLLACNDGGCVASAPVSVGESLVEAIGFIKASNADPGDAFGVVALSGDGNTLAVGASREDSNAPGIGGNAANDAASGAGAVYVFRRDEHGAWSQEAYVKASNPDADDRFGGSVALSEDGSTLVVGAPWERSNANGVGGDEANNSLENSGAVYVYTRGAMGAWAQTAYVKAIDSGLGDWFGSSVALSADGHTLAVGARYESGGSAGVGGDAADNSLFSAGAAYVYEQDEMGMWTAQAYIKASNPAAWALFGRSVALSADGRTLVVGAVGEDGGSAGIDGDQTDVSLPNSGAVYVFRRNGPDTWSQEAYIKASNPDPEDFFGRKVALSDDGGTLAVGASYEDSGATGIDGDEANNFAYAAGAVYVFARDELGAWSQEAYVKASNTRSGTFFGGSVALSADGGLLAAGAWGEHGSAAGLGGAEAGVPTTSAGAVYLFERGVMGAWSQRLYIKATKPAPDDAFGGSVALSDDGMTLAVGAGGEDSSAIGVGGSDVDASAPESGAVYLF